MLNKYLIDLNFTLELDRSTIFNDLLDDPSAKMRAGLFLFIRVPVRNEEVVSMMFFLFN